LLEKALLLFRELGDQIGIANVLAAYGFALRFAGEYAKATALFEESLAVRRTFGHNWDIGLALINLGYIALAQGDISRATALFEQSMALGKRNDYLLLVAWPLRGLGSAAWLQGDDAQAIARHTKSLMLYRQMGDRWGMAECLEGLALVACRPSQSPERIERGVRLLGAMEMREITGNPRPAAEAAWIEQAVISAQLMLGEISFTSALAEGRAMTLEQAIEYALSDSTDEERVNG
jgi:tetratricopeptide (TPR) repeat protein